MLVVGSIPSACEIMINVQQCNTLQQFLRYFFLLSSIFCEPSCRSFAWFDLPAFSPTYVPSVELVKNVTNYYFHCFVSLRWLFLSLLALFVVCYFSITVILSHFDCTCKIPLVLLSWGLVVSESGLRILIAFSFN